MKLLYTCIIEAESPLSIVSEESVFSHGFLTPFLHQHSVQLFRFVSTTIVDKLIQTNKKGYNSVHDGDLFLHCHIGSVIHVAITDKEYPPGVAYRLLGDIARPEANMETLFKKYSDVNNDAVYRIENDLEETKLILMSNVEKLFQRGEKLEDLVEKSEKLSVETKTFFKRARAKNRWCPWFW